MNSFYGGKQGGSFIIAKTYSTIAEMLESFGKNNPDCPVNFDEYVLINTVNKNNPENGQIFRRGYNYNGTAKITTYQRTYGKENPYETIEVDSCGAEYIGTIVGPAGRAPIFNFGHYKEIEDATESTTVDYSLIDTKDKPLTKELLEILNKKSFEELGLSKGKDFYSIVIKNIPNGTRNAYYRYDKKADGQNDWYVITKEEQQQNSNIQKKEIEYIQLTQLDNPTDEKIIEQLNSLNLVDLGFENIEGNNSFILTVKNILVYRIAYFCYDNKYKLNNQQSAGWYAVDTPPATGESEYKPSQGLIPGITYAYKPDKTFDYVHDRGGGRHIALGENEINKIKNQKLPDDQQISKEDMPYQDSIDWTYCTVRNENLEDSTAYIGFRFAYPVVEFETKQVDAYYNRNDENKESLIKDFKNINLITRIVNDYIEEKDENGDVQTIVESRPAKQKDIEKHPFYSLWEIAIPKGVKGESVCNFRVITANENVKALDLKDGKIQYDEKGYIKTIEDYSNENLTINKQDDIANRRQIFVFDIISYDRIKEGDIYTIYAGDYNVFKQDEAVKLDHNGQLTFTYTHDNPYLTKSEDWIHWIDKMHFNEDGTVTVTFNDLEWDVEQADDRDEIKNGILTKPYLLHWINKMNFADDGTVTVDFNNEDLNDGQIENGHINLPKLVKWINKISLDKETGHLYIEFNNDNVEGLQTKNIGTEEEPKFVSFIEQDLTWVKNIEFKEDGTVITDYTTDYQDGVDKREQPYLINWINQMNFSDNGTVTVDFNNENINNGQIKNGHINLQQLFKWITGVTLDKDNGHFNITFNQYKENEDGSLSNEFKQYDTDLTWLKYFNIDNEGNITYKYTYDTNESISRTDNNVIKWIENISLDEKDGHFIVNFNYDKDPNTNETTQINQFLTWIKDIKLDEDGTVHWEYTTSTDNHEEKNYIQWINDIVINDDGAGNGNQKLSIKYNNKNNYIDIGSPLNYVMRMAVNSANGDLLALYSDPEKRKSGYSYDGVSGWTVLGNVKYSKSMTKEAYNNATAAQRVSDLIAGAVCYRTEVIE